MSYSPEQVNFPTSMTFVSVRCVCLSYPEIPDPKTENEKNQSGYVPLNFENGLSVNKYCTCSAWNRYTTKTATRLVGSPKLKTVGGVSTWLGDQINYPVFFPFQGDVIDCRTHNPVLTTLCNVVSSFFFLPSARLYVLGSHFSLLYPAFQYIPILSMFSSLR